VARFYPAILRPRVGKRDDIRSILVIGSGPIVIGQACEFDYSGTQAVRALKREGYRVILVNSNPATIMTDPELADATYIEPLTVEFLERIVERERPDAILPTVGGQTAINLALALAEKGILERRNVKLIGANERAMRLAEDRDLFKKAMLEIGAEVPRSERVRTLPEAEAALKEIGLPVVVRPSFTLGGSGGGAAKTLEEFRRIVRHGLSESPAHEVLIEESVEGWKEFELEVMRDTADNVIIVCSIENFDAMGVHTGDSITVAPQMTLSDRQYQAMRDEAKAVIRKVGVDTGGSNIQFAVDPKTGRRVVIEMNPRVSRSSALASKATGFPIAKIAALLAVGYHLDEIPNDITKKTPASFEPSLDYVVVKIPRWTFEKFPRADNRLTIQMKSVGEAMAIGRTFPEALGKAIRSLEIGRDGLDDGRGELPREELLAKLEEPTPERLFHLRRAFLSGMTVEQVAKHTRIDPWFLDGVRKMVETEESFAGVRLESLDRERIRSAKRLGLSDRALARRMGCEEGELRARRQALGVVPVYKTIDTCAAEFEAETPYFYSTYEDENESIRTEKPKVAILGCGPNRIGQGIEFDYCCVHACYALGEAGFETIMINCNPETVSTDYDTSDRLYFEPLTLEDVSAVLDNERPDGILVQFGGQTPLKLARPLEAGGYPIWGTSPESIDLAEDRGRFGRLLGELGLSAPPHAEVRTEDEAVAAARSIGYPMVVRPSYVLGGRAMAIVFDDARLRAYMRQAVASSPEHPVLIDRFLDNAVELDVDALCDGKNGWIGGVQQHIEEAGIHSGDSFSVLPPWQVPANLLEEIRAATRRLAEALAVRGLVNIQFAIQHGRLYVLEVNPRASRTVPFVSKAIGVPMARAAALLTIPGRTLASLGLPPERDPVDFFIKAPVFPFRKFPGEDVLLGPEMKSTGEVMGISPRFGDAFAKACEAVGTKLPLSGRAFLTVNPYDKAAVIPIGRELRDLGFVLCATEGTREALGEAGVDAERVFKVNEGSPNAVDRMEAGDIQLVVNTPLGGESRFDEAAIRAAALRLSIPCLTTLSAATAAVEGIRSRQEEATGVAPLQEYHRA
jgi:carbamoyl-phosphate synthase large subunit